MRLEQAPDVVGLLDLLEIERRDGRARARTPLHETFERQSTQRIAHAGEPDMVAGREAMLVEAGARG